MDKMHEELVTATKNENYSLALHVTLALRKDLLNKYYSLTDNSEVYHIAMGECLMYCDLT